MTAARGFALASLALLLAACGGRGDAAERTTAAWGSAERGRLLIRASSCGACHAIPGIVGARGRFGPSLRGVARRSYVAGVLPNTPANLTRWVQHPRAVNARTAMPELGLTEAQARDVAAYLYELR